MKHPPYRLSINKSVDRYLLIELIRFAEKNQFIDMNNTEYFSLGGPFLIDQKLIHSFYPYLQLYSIEENSNTYLRQKRHVFCKNIQLISRSVATVVDEYEFSKSVIFWLDFTKITRSYLDDLANLSRKLPVNSIIKITFNISPPYKPSYSDKTQAMNSFQIKYNDYLSALDFEKISDPGAYQKLMIEIVKNAIAKLQKERKSPAQFVCCDVIQYSDTSPMLSISGILASAECAEKIQNALKDHAFFSPNIPLQINMPDFSNVERYHIDRELPCSDVGILYTALGYPIYPEESEPFADTKELLKFYARFWHKYPDFVRVMQ